MKIYPHAEHVISPTEQCSEIIEWRLVSTEFLVSRMRNVNESVRVSYECFQCLRAHRQYVSMVCDGFYWCERRRMMVRFERDMAFYSRIFAWTAEPIRYRRLATSAAWKAATTWPQCPGYICCCWISIHKHNRDSLMP